MIPLFDTYRWKSSMATKNDIVRMRQDPHWCDIKFNNIAMVKKRIRDPEDLPEAPQIEDDESASDTVIFRVPASPARGLMKT